MTQPVRFSGMAVSRSSPPPKLGADGRQVLSEVLGMDAGQIDVLVRDGVLANER
jgi:crotonobetainyl-CoA:carnitine CoA-transferase CaiB-like acyl-CoA transferase